MDFLERYLSISPDDGTGLLELGYCAVGVLAISLLAFRRAIARFVQGVFIAIRPKRA